jgi:hypothetical protein
MGTNHYSPRGVRWTMRIVASLFTTLIPWLGHDVHGYAAESPYAITVHQGRLSVHLQEADVTDVLTVIGQQAGITILGDPRPETRVSTQFTGMPLDEGLPRLLRLGSLSSTMVYAHTPTGAMVLTAVYAFEEGTGPAQHPQVAVELTAEDDSESWGYSFAQALAQASSAQHEGSRCWSGRYLRGVTLNRSHPPANQSRKENSSPSLLSR